MQGFPEADFRPREPKLFTELSTGGLRAKSRIESAHFRASLKPFQRRSARPSLPLNWRPGQRRARVPGSRASAIIALRRPPTAYRPLIVRLSSAYHPLILEIRPDAKVPAVITDIAITIAPIAATPPDVAVRPIPCIVRP